MRQFARVASRLAIAAAMFVSLLGFTSAPAGAVLAEEMSQRQAGNFYLETICRANAAEELFSKRIWRGRERISAPEVRRRLPELRRHSRRLSLAQSNAGRRLFNPPSEWPGYVSSQVGTMRNAYLRDADLRSQQGYAATADRWLRLNGRSNDLNGDMVRTSRKIRAILDLPPPGTGC